MSWPFSLIAAALLSVAGLAPLQASEAYRMTTRTDEADVRSMIANLLSGPYTDVGIAVGVIDGTESLLLGQGYTDNSRKWPVDGNTVFGIGDLTKVFTGLLLADMMRRGDVSGHDPTSKYFPSGASTTSGGEPSTKLIDLATSSAGVPRNLPRVSLFPRSEFVADAFWIRPPASVPSLDAAAFSGHSYSFADLGFGILGHALARRHKSSFRQVLSSRLLQPLSLDSTSLGPQTAARDRLAIGYDPNLKEAPSHRSSNMFGGADGLSSSANDMMRFAHAALNQKFTNFALAVRKSVGVRRATQQPSHLSAMGWIIFQHDGHNLLWRANNADGFSGWIGIDLSAKRAAIVLANVETTLATEIGFRLMRPETADRKIVAQTQLRRERLDLFEGRYRTDTGDILIVNREVDHLTLQLDKSLSKAAFPVSDRRFTMLDQAVTFTFDFESEDEKYPKRIIFYRDDAVEIAERVIDPVPPPPP